MTRHGPVISVVLPVLNGARFLREAIGSVLDQEEVPLELVVVDGGSTDGSWDIAEGIGDDRVRVVRQEGTGVAAAWNQGIDVASASTLAFLSSDDRWLPGKLIRQATLLDSLTGALCSITRFRYFLQPGCALPPGFNPSLLGRDLTGRIMETLVARRDLFTRIGRFDPTLRTAEDVDWYCRVAAAGISPLLVEEALLEKRIHESNLSMSGATNTPYLMEALRRSIARHREVRT